MRRSWIALTLSLALLVGGAVFTFDNYVRDYSNVPDWTPGDPWENRNPTLAQDGRDSSLETHVNADYVRRPFTATLNQVVTIASTSADAAFTRAAKVHVEMTILISGVGTIASKISVFPTGLPAVKVIGASGSSIGTFLYFRTAAGRAIAGIARYNGVFIDFFAGGDFAIGSLGVDPSFATASGDQLYINLSYLAAP